MSISTEMKKISIRISTNYKIVAYHMLLVNKYSNCYLYERSYYNIIKYFNVFKRYYNLITSLNNLITFSIFYLNAIQNSINFIYV